MASIRKVAASDVAPIVYRGGDMRIVLSPKNVGTTGGLLVTATIDPGDSVSEHYHPYSEESVYVVRGRLHVRLGGEWSVVEAGEAFVMAENVPHRWENRGDEQVFAVVYLSPLAPRPELGHVDTEPTPYESPRTVGTKS